ncbi:MAG: hypothetical protein Q8K71_04105 [Polaromonas sp.]|nr:hypothetical protein [Polaromonas sp.]MDP3753141.1 hypothetical protein [Polaromonas sp.]
MTISPRRKRTSVVLALFLLTGLAWVVWPFMTNSDEIKKFCGALTMGASAVQVQAQAKQQGYRVSSLVEGRAFVHDSKAFGRFTCDLQFGPDGLVSAVYSFND